MNSKSDNGSQEIEREGYLIGKIISITCTEGWILIDKSQKRDLICTLNDSIGTWKPWENSSWDLFSCIGTPVSIFLYWLLKNIVIL